MRFVSILRDICYKFHGFDRGKERNGVGIGNKRKWETRSWRWSVSMVKWLEIDKIAKNSPCDMSELACLGQKNVWTSTSVPKVSFSFKFGPIWFIVFCKGDFAPYYLIFYFCLIASNYKQSKTNKKEYSLSLSLFFSFSCSLSLLLLFIRTIHRYFLIQNPSHATYSSSPRRK